MRKAIPVAVVAAIVISVITIDIDHHTLPTAAATAPVLRVRTSDFKLVVEPQGTIRAGRTKVTLTNVGPGRHELIVVRGGRNLPYRLDGLTVNEERLDIIGLNAIEPIRAGATGSMTIRLTPGRYQIFCNMAGHYLGGMRSELRVRT